MARKAARKSAKPVRRAAPKRAAPKRAAPKRAAQPAAARPAAGRRVIKGRAPSGLPFSPGVVIGNALFVSGTTPFAKDGSIARGDFAAQMHQVMANIKQVLDAAGSSFDQVGKVNVYLARVSDFFAMNDIFKQYFKEGNYPARTTIEAALPHPDFLLEIECVAAV